MPLHPFAPPAGRLVDVDVASARLANRYGDPTTRRVPVYLAPGHEGAGPLPLLVDLAAYTSSGPKRLAWRPFEESLPQRVDRLVASGAMPPVAVAMPDAFTSFGGNQYTNSATLGAWRDWVAHDLVDAVVAACPVRADAAGRAVYGKSSGGYGALLQALYHPDRWGAFACHSGDAGFEWAVRPAFPDFATRLARYGGSPAAMFDAIRALPKIDGKDLHDLMMLGLCVAYDADPDAPHGLRIPFDPHTCEVDADRWAAWIAHDPVEIVRDAARLDGLRRAKLLFLDCGDRDEYHLQYGARRFVRTLADAGVAHVYEEFAGTHRDTDHRLDVSLPRLAAAIGGAS
jgi:S-formylglutathione hydrolase FrmB